MNPRAILADAYASTTFVEVLTEGQFPDVHSVARSNRCRIGLATRGRRTVIVSAIDNLVKGAAGQAIQNLNIMLGFDAATGLAL